MYKLRLYISQNYQSQRYCHRVTKNGLTPIFTSHKMKKKNEKKNSIPKLR
jgi:hypothetical protein